MNEKKLYDFYTDDKKYHFDRRLITEKHAIEYSKKYGLYFELVE